MAISVVIISYKDSEYLDICLRSAFENQVNENEIICVLDGPESEGQEVVKKYPKLHVVDLPENKGQTYCHNVGVTLASNKWILVINADNVLPPNWDVLLEEAARPNHVISPNQIEPASSIFPDFVIEDFGKTVSEFRYDDFMKFSNKLNHTHQLAYNKNEEAGQTWPLFMEKRWYMILNGIDSGYENPAYADWDFFMRCELAGLRCTRYFGCHIYHFAGASTKRTPEQAAKHQDGERRSLEYFQWKWKVFPIRDSNNSLLNALRGKV